MAKNVLEYLEASAQRVPDKVAFADEKTSITYKKLLQNSMVLGTALSKKVAVQSPVTVLMEKGVGAIIAFMGTVYAGCFYSFLNTKHPIARLLQIKNILNATVVITDKAHLPLAEQLFETENIVLVEDFLEADFSLEQTQSVLLPIRKVTLDVDPLYVNFTSGSTGTPKGVVVCHRSVIDFMDVFPSLFNITEQDVIGNQAPFDFDVSVKDIYSTLSQGATMQIIPKKMFSFPTTLLDFLCERKITTLIWAVSALCIITTLKGFDYKVPTTVNKILFSGEVMPIKHLNLWKEHLPQAMYVNLYGPTEITCNCTYFIVDRAFDLAEKLPIGKAFPNENVFLLDETDNKVIKEGEIGEICVSGTALGLGYFNNLEQTQKVFVQNPLNNKYLETIYRTGDLGCYNAQGELCFVSRKDFQIKHMGHRIELGEVEANIQTLPEIVRVCCIYDEEKNQIIAFFKGETDKKQIIKALSDKLPSYMFPNRFCKVEEMPLTENGKIDRKALLQEFKGAK